MLKHTFQSGHPSVSLNYFRKLQKGCNNKKSKNKNIESPADQKTPTFVKHK